MDLTKWASILMTFYGDFPLGIAEDFTQNGMRLRRENLYFKAEKSNFS
jgi:hypothetical protein